MPLPARLPPTPGRAEARAGPPPARAPPTAGRAAGAGAEARPAVPALAPRRPPDSRFPERGGQQPCGGARGRTRGDAEPPAAGERARGRCGAAGPVRGPRAGRPLRRPAERRPRFPTARRGPDARPRLGPPRPRRPGASSALARRRFCPRPPDLGKWAAKTKANGRALLLRRGRPKGLPGRGGAGGGAGGGAASFPEVRRGPVREPGARPCCRKPAEVASCPPDLVRRDDAASVSRIHSGTLRW